MTGSACAGALLHAAEAAHNSVEPQQHVLQHALQEGHAQGPPALAGPAPAAPLDVTGCLQQLLQGQQVVPLLCQYFAPLLWPRRASAESLVVCLPALTSYFSNPWQAAQKPEKALRHALGSTQQQELPLCIATRC